MFSAIFDVAAFHKACGVPILDKPTIPSPERIALRRSLISEEVNNELFPAMMENDLPGIADAIGDSIYVLIGTALEYGIPLDMVWNTIQAANMAKVDPVTGLVNRRADGKILKPEGWTPPNIIGVLASVSKEV